MTKITPETLDALLPQTQCGLCGYGGCMPYAEAMVFEGASINLCPPGGVKTMQELGALLGADPNPHIAEMEKKAKPRLRAVIRESECIGCTKCITSCPVDAIVGAAKLMHTIIADQCTGCELCIPPCPVDCISLVPDISDENLQDAKKNKSRERYQHHQQRLAKIEKQKQSKLEKDNLEKKKRDIAEAILRAKLKKSLTNNL